MIRILLTIAIVTGVAACSGSRAQDAETLPGRSRPLLQHNWPHPRDLEFSQVAFRPPDAPGSMLTTVSGLRALVLESAADPMVRITAAIPLGRLYEQPGESGAATLLVRALAGDGSGGPAAKARLLRLERLGGKFEIVDSPDLTLLTVHTLPDRWQEGVRHMVELLRDPLLEAGAIDEFRIGTGFTATAARVEDAAFRPTVELERRLVGYPLAPPEPGTRVSPAAVRALAARALRPDTVVLGIGGPVSRDAAQRALGDCSRDWVATGPAASATTRRRPAASGGQFVAIDTPETNDSVPRQGWIAMGRVIGPVPDADRPAVAVMGEVLGNRLNIAAREIRGLANHTILVMPETRTGDGLLHVRTGGRQEAVAPLVKVCLEEIRGLHGLTVPITEEEMRRAKGTLILGVWQKSLDGAQDASATFAVETVRRGSTVPLLQWPSVVEPVTIEQVNKAAKTYLDPAAMTTVVVGPIENIRSARHPRWPATLEELGFQLRGETAHSGR